VFIMAQVIEMTSNQLMAELEEHPSPTTIIGVMLLPEYPKLKGFTIEQFQEHCFHSIDFCGDRFTGDSAMYFIWNYSVVVHNVLEMDALRNHFEQAIGDLHEKVEYEFRFIITTEG